MWSKTFKPGEVKVKRDVAMTEQAELILRKKAEIEARLAVDGQPGAEAAGPGGRKPISLSIGKRWCVGFLLSID
jgi:hypothetical protein